MIKILLYMIKRARKNVIIIYDLEVFYFAS